MHTWRRCSCRSSRIQADRRPRPRRWRPRCSRVDRREALGRLADRDETAGRRRRRQLSTTRAGPGQARQGVLCTVYILPTRPTRPTRDARSTRRMRRLGARGRDATLPWPRADRTGARRQPRGWILEGFRSVQKESARQRCCFPFGRRRAEQARRTERGVD